MPGSALAAALSGSAAAHQASLSNSQMEFAGGGVVTFAGSPSIDIFALAFDGGEIYDTGRTFAGGMTAIQWLVEGFLETDALSMVYGPPSSGKSFIAIDLAHQQLKIGRAHV